MNVRALGRLTTPEQFGDIIVKSDSQGRATRIRDIGHVELGSLDYSSKAYADRYDSAPFWVIATPGADVVQVEHEVWDKMAELKENFPPGIDYINIYDPTTFVSQSICISRMPKSNANGGGSTPTAVLLILSSQAGDWS